MTRGDKTVPARMPYPRFVALAAGLVAALWVIGYLPTTRFVGDAAFPSMLCGGILSLAASLVGTVPLLLVRGRPPALKVAAVMGSIALRLVVLLLLASAVALAGLVAWRPLVAWAVLSHFGLLVVDTFFARAEIRADDPTISSAAATA